MFHELDAAYTTSKQMSAALTAVAPTFSTPVIYIVLRSSNESAAPASFTAMTYTCRYSGLKIVCSYLSFPCQNIDSHYKYSSKPFKKNKIPVAIAYY